MKRRFLKKPQVERDLVDHFSYIAADKLEPAEKFLEAAEHSFMFLAANPEIGARWDSSHPRLADIRMHSMAKPYRKYVVFYRVIEHGVEILTVLHSSRDLAAMIDQMTSEE
jgi:toxin ParE1/3/4